MWNGELVNAGGTGLVGEGIFCNFDLGVVAQFQDSCQQVSTSKVEKKRSLECLPRRRLRKRKPLVRGMASAVEPANHFLRKHEFFN